MQPPPPAGWTGKAPPGLGGGVTVEDEAAVEALGATSPGDHANATTSAARTPHNAVTGWACRYSTILHCS